MVVTDSALAPRLRYCAILDAELGKEGFKYLKSKNSFVRPFQFGEHRIRLQFISSMGLIHSVGCHLSIYFEELETQYCKAYGTKRDKWTVAHILPYTSEYLFNKETGEYTDLSLNKAANEFFTTIKPEIDNICIDFRSAEALTRHYLAQPFQHQTYQPSLDRSFGLILLLSRIFEPNTYQQTKQNLFSFMSKQYKTFNTIENELRSMASMIDKYIPPTNLSLCILTKGQ